MKKYFEVAPNVEDFKNRVVMVKEGNNKKPLLILGVLALLAGGAVAYALFMKKSMLSSFDDDWDYDWDDLEDEFSNESEDVADFPIDIDSNVVVEEV